MIAVVDNFHPLFCNISEYILTLKESMKFIFLCDVGILSLILGPTCDYCNEQNARPFRQILFPLFLI
jgi:hypothetical protein